MASGAPEPIGPYVHAVKSHGLLFCSGQLPQDPETGELVSAGKVTGALRSGKAAAEQTTQCLQNLAAVAAGAGATLFDAVRCSVYLTDMSDLQDVNEAYEGYFGASLPARVNFGVAALPMDARVNIDAVIALSR